MQGCVREPTPEVVDGKQKGVLKSIFSPVFQLFQPGKHDSKDGQPIRISTLTHFVDKCMLAMDVTYAVHMFSKAVKVGCLLSRFWAHPTSDRSFKVSRSY